MTDEILLAIGRQYAETALKCETLIQTNRALSQKIQDLEKQLEELKKEA